MNVSPLSLSSPTYHPQDPSPFNEMQGMALQIQEAVSGGRELEAIDRIQALYGSATGLNKKALLEYTHSCFGVIRVLCDILALPSLSLGAFSVKRPLAKTLRLFLEILFWQKLLVKPSRDLSYKERLLPKKFSDWGEIEEENANTIRTLLEKASQSTPHTEVALRFDLTVSLQVFNLLPASHQELCWEYGQFFFDTLSGLSMGEGNLEKVGEGISIIRSLNQLKVEGWISEILYLHWIKHIACHNPLPHEVELRELIGKKREKKNVALCAIEVWGDFIWHAPSSFHKKALDELSPFANAHGKILRGSLWEVRYLALTHLKCIRTHHPDENIREAANLVVENALLRNKDTDIQELLLSPDPIWNDTLHAVQPEAGPSYQQIRREREAASFGIYLQAHPEVALKLVKLFDEDPNFSALDLGAITAGIAPETFLEAMSKAKKLTTLSLEGHTNLTVQHLITADIMTLKDLDLTGHPITDQDLEKLLNKYPQLESLTLNQCPHLTGRHLELFKGHTLKLRGIRAKHSLDLERIMAGLQELDLSESTMSLGVLKAGHNLLSLHLSKRTLGGNDLTYCKNLVTLDLEEANGKLAEALSSLPNSLETLILSKCPNINDAVINSLIQNTPQLKHLYLWETDVEGVDIQGAFPHLCTLHLAYIPGKTPITLDNFLETPHYGAALAKSCPALVTLVIGSRLFECKDLTAIISSTPNLTDLKAIGCRTVDEDFLRTLLTCPIKAVECNGMLDEIERLDLSNTSFSDEYLFLLAKCHSLTHLNVANTPFTKLGALLRACPKLQTLNLAGCDSLLKEGVLDLSDLPQLSDALLEQIFNAIPDLTRLNLSKTTTLTEEQLIQTITSQRQLVELDFSGHRLTTFIVKALKEMTALEKLDLSRCTQLVASDMAAFARLSHLKELVLNNVPPDTASKKLELSDAPFICDEMLAHILRQIPNLQHLFLNHCPLITKEGLSRLTTCPHLEVLVLKGCSEINPQDILNIFNTLPAAKTLIIDTKVIRRQIGETHSFIAPPQQLSESSPSMVRIHDEYQSRLLEEELRGYQSLFVEDETGVSKTLVKAFDEFLQNAHPCLLLAGDIGAGKSISLKFLEQQVWEKNPSPQHIPLFIDLKEKNQADLISVKLREMGFNSSQIEELQKNQTFLFLLDGFDEMATQIPLSKLKGHWQGKFVVSCRTQFLDQNKESWSHWFTIERSTWTSCSILPLNADQIKGFLDSYLTDEAASSKIKYLKAIHSIEGLPEMASSPLLLRLLIEALPPLSEQKKIKRVEIYENFVESWFLRASNRIRGRIPSLPRLRQLYEFAGRLAFAMMQRGVTEAYDETAAWRDFFSEDVRNICELCPLKYLGKGCYTFFHTSLLEFFASEHLFNALLMKDDHDEDSRIINTRIVLGNLEQNSLNQKRRPLDQEAEGREAYLISKPGVLEFLKEKIAQVSHREERLTAIVLASKERDVLVAASNALALLNLCGYPLSGLNLSHIRAPYVNLEGALLYRTNLSNADLRRANLTKARLSYANLVDANLEGVEFGQSPTFSISAGRSMLWWWATFTLSFACAPCGSQAALCLNNGCIEIWDWAEAKRLFILDGSCASTPSFNPSGTLLASAGKYRSVLLWNTQNGELISTFYGHTVDVTHVVFNPDGTELVSADSEGTLLRWKVSDGSSIGNPMYGGCISSLAYHPQREEIAWGCRDGTVQRYDLITEAPIDPPLHVMVDQREVPIDPLLRSRFMLEQKERDVYLAYNPNGLELAGHSKGELRRWDIRTGALIKEPPGEHPKDIECLAYSPDGTLIATSDKDGVIRFWSVTTGSQIGELLLGGIHEGRGLAFTPNGKEILLSGSSLTVHRLKVPKSAIIQATPSGHTEAVITATLSPDGKRIVSSGEDFTLRLWDVTTGEEVVKLSGLQGRTQHCTFSPDGSEILFDEGNTLKRCDPLTGAQIGEPFKGHVWKVLCVAYSPLGDQIASGDIYGHILRWDPVGNRVGESLECKGGVREVTYSRDGRFLIAGGANARVYGWDAQTGECLWEHSEGHTLKINCVAFSPLENEFVSGSEYTMLRRWDTHTGVSVEPPFKGHKKQVCSVAYSPDGKEILSGSWDTTARIWNISTAQCVDVLTLHWDSILSVSWPKQDTLLTTSADWTLALWKLLPMADNTSKWCPVWQSKGKIDLMTTHALLNGAHLSQNNALLLKQKRPEREGYRK